MAAPGATPAERKKAAEEANKALAQSLLGDTTDTDDDKSASLPEESANSSDTDISVAEKKLAKKRKRVLVKVGGKKKMNRSKMRKMAIKDSTKLLMIYMGKWPTTDLPPTNLKFKVFFTLQR